MSKKPAGIKQNVTNFHSLIITVEGFGLTWMPVQESLQVAQLKARHAAAESAFNVFNAIDALDKQKTAERKAAYIALNYLVRRGFHAANACKMDAVTIDRIKTLKDLIVGTNKNRAAAKREKNAKKMQKNLPAGATMPDLPDPRSVLQLAYDTRFDNFSKLITALETSEKYKTLEADLTLDALKTYLLLLKTVNEATKNADMQWKAAAAERNRIITAKVDSIYSDVIDIKAQMKSMKSVSKETHKEVSKLKFVKMR